MRKASVNDNRSPKDVMQIKLFDGRWLLVIPAIIAGWILALFIWMLINNVAVSACPQALKTHAECHTIWYESLVNLTIILGVVLIGVLPVLFSVLVAPNKKNQVAIIATIIGLSVVSLFMPYNESWPVLIGITSTGVAMSILVSRNEKWVFVLPAAVGGWCAALFVGLILYIIANLLSHISIVYVATILGLFLVGTTPILSAVRAAPAQKIPTAIATFVGGLAITLNYALSIQSWPVFIGVFVFGLAAIAVVARNYFPTYLNVR